MHASSPTTSNTQPNTMKILVVTYTMTSHVYATAKMTRLFDAQDGKYDVEYALPDHLPSIELVQTLLPSHIPIRRIGTVSTKKQMNVRTVTDPTSWSTLFKAVRNPFPFAANVNTLFDEQEGMYEPLKDLIRTGNYDCIVGIHSACVTISDALESLQIHEQITIPQFVILSSLPYDPAIQTNPWKTWKEPRTITAFPHVCIYPSKPTNIFSWISMRFWQLLDTFVVWKSWKNATPTTNERRSKRMLPPVSDPWSSYLQKHPNICFGGVQPLFGEYHEIPSNVTCIGSLDVPEIETTSNKRNGISDDLQAWLDGSSDNDNDDGNSSDYYTQDDVANVIYIGFGTGTMLSDQEVIACTSGLLKSIEEWPIDQRCHLRPRILFALRQSEIERLVPIISTSLGIKPTFQTTSRIEFGPSLRIESDLPQASLLKKAPEIGLFISHMGMGGFVEGVAGGVPFLCYPSGLDQYYNTQRAVEAGIAERIVNMNNLAEQVYRVWRDPSIIAASKQAQQALSNAKGNERALATIDEVIESSKNDNSIEMGTKSTAASQYTLGSKTKSATGPVVNQRLTVSRAA